METINPEIFKEVLAENPEKKASNEKEFNYYFISRLISALNKERRDKSILVRELDSVTEGKNIVLSNAH